jgi:hypothetical protein
MREFWPMLRNNSIAEFMRPLPSGTCDGDHLERVWQSLVRLAADSRRLASPVPMGKCRMGSTLEFVRRTALTDFADLEMESVEPVPMLLLGIGAVALFITGGAAAGPQLSSGSW